MEAIGTVHVRMRPPGSTSRDDDHLIDANVALSQATIFIVLRDHEGPWPVTIENDSSFDVSIGQIVSFMLVKPCWITCYNFFNRMRCAKGQKRNLCTE